MDEDEEEDEEEEISISEPYYTDVEALYVKLARGESEEQKKVHPLPVRRTIESRLTLGLSISPPLMVIITRRFCAA